MTVQHLQWQRTKMAEKKSADAGHEVPKSPKMICPIHGLVDATPEGEDYRCSGSKSCNVIRKEKELET